MSDTTARLSLPFIDAGQAAKELTHNEALARLDLAVQASVLTLGDTDPPGDPGIGAAWIVGAAPVGAWLNEAGSIAGWTPSGWRFVRPIEGMAAWVVAAGLPATYRDGAWVLGEVACSHVAIGGLPVVKARAAAISEPVEGTTIDAEGRAAIAAILTALRHHGLIAAD